MSTRVSNWCSTCGHSEVHHTPRCGTVTLQQEQVIECGCTGFIECPETELRYLMTEYLLGWDRYLDKDKNREQNFSMLEALSEREFYDKFMRIVEQIEYWVNFRQTE